RWRRRCWTGGSFRWRPRASASSPAPTSARTWRWRRFGATSMPRSWPEARAPPATWPSTAAGPGASPLPWALGPCTTAGRGAVPDHAFISAQGQRVVIIGGGDTGADCLGTAHRQEPISVHQLEILERPPDRRAPDNPWPQWPNVYRMSSAHEEGGERVYAVST